MDKNALQEKFEDIAIQNCWNINKYPAGWDGHSDDEYVDDFVNGAWWCFQYQQKKVEELQKRLDGALKETQYALQYVEEDMRGNHEFLQMAMIRTLKALEQVLNGGA
ncbi:hypothetical protein [Acinetobacter baumannii]|uniref:hypothetical protein n=1 Tax=Acinetobacter baumannii TaxID=470 RepID=UPI000BF4B609|nr:hypothetical protein [Acinetobacter baumannii]MDC4764842.1 hypothetical protein [Acinetobacter baumannii]MDC5134378.1 hypothetical protein [Acinetobacter baumannii]MDC5147890.1 hypothetical protein [Acinetobacter baumannii]MDC5503479.1 hypothetical protein [Acinetobacter baumannii]MDC5511283.1 hypothetical protein [Acinetobacter baumannii]